MRADDSSTKSISSSGNVLSFTTKAGSYFYETFDCQSATSNGYNTLKFDLTGIKGATFTFEIQTKKSCSDKSYTSKYIGVSAITGQWQTVEIPLQNFAGANADVVTGLVWQDFSSTGNWKLRNLYFGCGGAAAASSSAPAQLSSSTRPAVSSEPISSVVVVPTTPLSTVVPSTSGASVVIVSTSVTSSVIPSTSGAISSSALASSSARASSSVAQSSSAAQSSSVAQSSSAAQSSSVAPSSSRASSTAPGSSSAQAGSTSASASASSRASSASSVAASSSALASSTAPSSVRVDAASTSSSASATPSLKSSSDGTCGGTSKYTCVGFSGGECCSQYGWCGSTTAYCGTGCNPLYGKCTSSSSSSAASSGVSSLAASSGSSRASSASASGSASSSRASSSAAPSSASALSVTSTSSRASSVTSSRATTLSTSVLPSGSCAAQLIDDFASQSRLTFLFYNAMLLPTSDDATMTSVVVSNNRATYTPKDTSSYWYTQFGCFNAKNIYGGISFRLKAAKGTTFAVQLESSATCDPSKSTQQRFTTTELGWTFDGTEKLYTVPFSKYSNLDTSKLTTFFFDSFTKPVTYGPMAFYCGDSKSEYVVTTTSVSAGPSSTVAAPSGTAAALTVDKFAAADSNALGFWHGYDDGMSVTISGGKAVIKSTDSDYSFYSQLSSSCTDYTKYKGSYLHIAYTGTVAFTVSLQQHNSQCKDTVAPFPATWDSVEASRYASNGHIYIPMSHFNIDLKLTVGIAIKGFYKSDQVTLSLIEIVPSVSNGFQVPNKLESGNLVFACTRPNSFAFAIDDGSPEYAQQVLKIIKEENIKVTFFTVGAPLLDASTNLTNVYKEMEAAGHQIALHSFTHPKMEGLPDYAAIDWEYQNDIDTVKKQFNGLTTSYFRPPFGTEGARMRQRLPPLVPSTPKFTMWSVDVEDWLWAETDTPEQQKVSFQRDVDAGGNLVVMHYLYPTTVSYLQEFIQIAKKTGKQLMRVDQCMQDPNAPPL